MYFKIVDSPEDIEAYKKVLFEQSTLNKLDIVSTGIRDKCLEMLELSQTTVPSLVPMIGYNSDGDCLGVNMVKLGEKIQCWYQRFAYTSSVGRERYGVNLIQVEAMRFGFECAESRNYHEFYYVQRLARSRLLEPLFKEADFLQKYIIEDVEYIPPYSHSINPNIRTYIHGSASGMFPKTMVVKRFYNPTYIKYAYPYPSPN